MIFILLQYFLSMNVNDNLDLLSRCAFNYPNKQGTYLYLNNNYYLLNNLNYHQIGILKNDLHLFINQITSDFKINPIQNKTIYDKVSFNKVIQSQSFNHNNLNKHNINSYKYYPIGVVCNSTIGKIGSYI